MHGSSIFLVFIIFCLKRLLNWPTLNIQKYINSILKEQMIVKQIVNVMFISLHTLHMIEPSVDSLIR